MPRSTPQTTVDCRQPSTDPVPAPPIESEKDWVERGTLWAVGVLRTLTQERAYRAVEHECQEREAQRRNER